MQQFDKESIKLFLGGNSVEDGDLVYAQEKPRATTRALFGVGYDGDNIFLVHGPKTDITANGDFEAADTESLSSLPIKFTFLKEASAKGTFGLSPVLKIADLVTPDGSGFPWGDTYRCSPFSWLWGRVIVVSGRATPQPHHLS